MACTEPQCLYSTAIPRLPLWTVQPVHSLYIPSVPVQYSYTSTPLYAPYGLYRASVPVQYSYTYTPPMGRTACTEPQCLYSTAIPLLPSMDRTACTEPQCLYSTAIPILPLWTVRPVQSLSAYTSVHFTFFYLDGNVSVAKNNLHFMMDLEHNISYLMLSANMNTTR
jgi:hypothetical protein